MVVSLYDSMNYLQKLNQWELAINNIFTQLKPDGLFIFDVSTLFNSKTYFRENFYRRECNDGFYTRRSSFDEKRMIQHNIFEIRLNQHPDFVFIEHHKQIIRTLQQILLIVKRTHFKMVGCYAEFSLRPGTEKAKRVHFVLKK